MWDPTFRLPAPPVDAVAPSGFSMACAIFYALCAFAALIYALKHWRDTGRPILFMILIGGGLTVLVEPFVDLMGAAFHPRHGHAIVFEFMGRPIPWWMISAYFAYFGAMGSINYLAFARGVSMKAIRLWFLIPMLVDVLIEEVMLHQDLYLYYGAQPLILLWKLPMWWVPCNSIGEFIGVTLVVLSAPYLKGYKLLLIPLMIPLADCVGYAAVALPSWIVINTPVPYWINQLAGMCTFLLAFLIVHAIGLVLAVDSPLRRRLRAETMATTPSAALSPGGS